MEADIEKLLHVIEEKLGWGDCISWQSTDFENLQQQIFNETGVSLSSSTLRRIWGKVEYKSLPSSTTLNTLSKFAGFDNWRNFRMQNAPKATAPFDIALVKNMPVTKRNRSGKKLWIFLMFLLAGAAGLFAVEKSKRSAETVHYQFDSRRLTSEIPNSVLFTYDASSSPTDSIYIQQSWDSITRTWVDKNLHKHTSVYYEPGFYQAKLIVDKLVVQEHPLLIPTHAWLGLIMHNPVPVYLNSDEFIFKDSLQLTVQAIEKRHIQMEPETPLVKFYNVGNFEPVPLTNFSFSADIKNEYREGSAACQLTGIDLITDGMPVFIPLSVTGCVSELNLMTARDLVSGKTADLSGFGVDFSRWVQVSCRSRQGKILFFVNGKSAYESFLPAKPVKIVGFAFMFKGTGAVKNISLRHGDKKIFQAW